MAICYKLKPELINNEYVEENQEAPPERQSLAKIYTHIDQFRFEQAFNAIHKHEREYGKEFDLTLLRFQLTHALNEEARIESLIDLINTQPFTHQQTSKLANAWQESKAIHNELDTKDTVQLAMNLISPEHLPLVEEIFNRLYSNKPEDPRLVGLAQKLAFIFEKQKDKGKAKQYQTIADHHSQGNI